MAIADMFLKVQGVTGESGDPDHTGEIEVVSWSWGMQGSISPSGEVTAQSSVTELRVVKRVDLSSPTLMLYLHNHKLVPKAQLTVRKAGTKPLEYFKIELENVRVTSLQVESDKAELTERVSLGFQKVRVSYVPQSAAGARGGGTNMFELDIHAK